MNTMVWSTISENTKPLGAIASRQTHPSLPHVFSSVLSLIATMCVPPRMTFPNICSCFFCTMSTGIFIIAIIPPFSLCCSYHLVKEKEMNVLNPEVLRMSRANLRQLVPLFNQEVQISVFWMCSFTSVTVFLGWWFSYILNKPNPTYRDGHEFFNCGILYLHLFMPLVPWYSLSTPCLANSWQYSQYSISFKKWVNAWTVTLTIAVCVCMCMCV